MQDTRRKKPNHIPPERRQIGVSAPAAQAAAAGWILSAFWDSLLFIGAPVTCILALFPLRRYWRAQEYSFLLLAFLTFGHHLPGLIRAYGDASCLRGVSTPVLVSAAPHLFNDALV